MIKVIYFFLSVFVFSCAIEKKVIPNDIKENNTKNSHEEKIISATIGVSKYISSPTTISSISISGNIMTMYISYSGGCKEHEFQVFGSSMIEKSLPPIRTFQLIHINNNDTCEKLIKEKINIDISELAYKKEKGSEIYLTVNGWKEKIKYVYE